MHKANVFAAAALLGATAMVSDATTYVSARASDENITWSTSTHWSPNGIPGAGDTISLANPTALEENNVNQGGDGGTTLNSIGHVTLDGNSPDETGYRFRRGCINFDNNGSPSVLTLLGTADTTLQFRYNQAGQRIALMNDVIAVSSNLVGRIDLRGNITSGNTNRNIIKRGPGELRFRDTLDTSGYRGDVKVEEGVLRFRMGGLTGLQSTNAIIIQSGGQLRLDGQDTIGTHYVYHFGGAEIRISGFGRADPLDAANGAIRQHDGRNHDVATVTNRIVVAGDASVHTDCEDGSTGSVLYLTGNISGNGIFNKTGDGLLYLSGTNTPTGMRIQGGTVALLSDGALPNGSLQFSDAEIRRTLNLFGTHTVTSLDGDALDPDVPGSTNALTINLGGAGTALIVNQAIAFDDGAEADTRFQGDIAGAGGLVKAGSGMLRFSRWPKNYTGPTIVSQGVLSVAASAAPVKTSSVIVEDGGQLRLTSSGDDVQHVLGGDIVLHGSGRSGGAILPGQNGALRYDPGNTDNIATVTNRIVLQSDARIHVEDDPNALVLSRGLAGSGALTKSGGGTLVLGGTSGHDGDVTVISGTLGLTGAFLDGDASLSVSNGAGLSLDFAGTNQVAELLYAGTAQSPGTWGAAGSGADHEAAWMAGTGRLLVPSSAPEPFLITSLDFQSPGTGLQGRETNVVAVTFGPEDDATYTLQYRTNLLSGAWSNVASATVSPLVHTNATPDPMGFYRIMGH